MVAKKQGIRYGFMSSRLSEQFEAISCSIGFSVFASAMVEEPVE